MIPALVAEAGTAQVAFDVITQVTTAPLVSVVVVYVALLVPTLVPLTFHWYAGALPPLVGVAVKVTDAPEADGFVPAVMAILTAGATDGLTVMVIALLLALGVVAQDELEVNVHATTAPLVNAVVVNVAALVPATLPFTVQA